MTARTAAQRTKRRRNVTTLGLLASIRRRRLEQERLQRSLNLNNIARFLRPCHSCATCARVRDCKILPS